MATNSKNKGNKWERTVSKLFEKWTGYKFSRTPGSGGWAKAKDSFGDIVCTDDKHSRRFPLSIECKSYSDIRFEHILLGNKTCKIMDFWEQTIRDANIVKKLPILIMRYNSMPKDEAFVVIDYNLANLFLKNSEKPEFKHNFKKPIMAINLNKDNTNNVCIYIFMLSDFLEQDYKNVYKAARYLLKKQKKLNDLPF